MQKYMLQKKIFILHRNLSENIPNIEIIAIQINSDTENNEMFYIANNIQYTEPHACLHCWMGGLPFVAKWDHIRKVMQSVVLFKLID